MITSSIAVVRRPKAVPELQPYFDVRLNKMTRQDWLDIPPTWVSLTELIPTQKGIFFDTLSHLVSGGEVHEDDDVYGHAIMYPGKLYSYDSHHRDALK